MKGHHSACELTPPRLSFARRTVFCPISDPPHERSRVRSFGYEPLPDIRIPACSELLCFILLGEWNVENYTSLPGLIVFHLNSPHVSIALMEHRRNRELA